MNSHFPGDDGELFKTANDNETTDGGSRIRPFVRNVIDVFEADGVIRPARYRWTTGARSRGSRTRLDDTSIIDLMQRADDTGPDYEQRLFEIIDMDNWMRTFALIDLASFWDAFGNRNWKNTYLYKPDGGKWVQFTWDFDVGLGVFNAVSSMTDSIAENAGVQDSDGLIGGLMLIGGIPGALILPILSDKFRKRKVFLVICIAGMVPGIFGLTFAGDLSTDPSTVYTVSLVSSFVLGFFIMSAGPLGFQYAAEVSHPAPESTSQGMLLWVGQVTGMIFVAGMSVENNRYLPAFMISFAVLSLFSLAAVLFLRESPMIITERDRMEA